jgi:SWIM/SEC-C metal-binding protein
MSLDIPIARRRTTFRAHRLASQARIEYGRRLVGLHGIQSRGNMAKLGTGTKPITVRVQTEDRGRYVAQRCAERGWHYIIGFEPDEPEDISDLEMALNPPIPMQSEKVGRNDACPCGSGKKYKKYCGASVLPHA